MRVCEIGVIFIIGTIVSFEDGEEDNDTSGHWEKNLSRSDTQQVNTLGQQSEAETGQGNKNNNTWLHYKVFITFELGCNANGETMTGGGHDKIGQILAITMKR